MMMAMTVADGHDDGNQSGSSDVERVHGTGR